MAQTKRFITIESDWSFYEECDCRVHFFKEENSPIFEGTLIGYIISEAEGRFLAIFSETDAILKKYLVKNGSRILPPDDTKNTLKVYTDDDEYGYRIAEIKPMADAIADGEFDENDIESCFSYYHSPGNDRIYVYNDQRIEFEKMDNEESCDFFKAHEAIEWLINADKDGSYVKFGQPFVKVCPTRIASKIQKKAKIATLKENLTTIQNDVRHLKREIEELNNKKTNLIEEMNTIESDKKTELSRMDSEAEKKAETTISIATNEALLIEEKSKNEAQIILTTASQKAQKSQNKIDKKRNKIISNAVKLSYEAHIEQFSARISEMDQVALNHREKLRRLHMSIGEALQKSQGAKPGVANDLDEAMHKGDKIDLLYRYYSQKIAEYKADEMLDPDIKQAAILGLQEQLERQIQEISGAFEPS